MRSMIDSWRGASVSRCIIVPLAVLVLAVMAFGGSLKGAVATEGPSDDSQIAAEVEASADAPAEAGFTRTDALIASVTIFVLSIFVGFELITKVPPTLHTPLMSGSNAISGITVVGALLVTGLSDNSAAKILGACAVLRATINVVGGFLVTHRMLSMFKRK